MVRDVSCAVSLYGIVPLCNHLTFECEWRADLQQCFFPLQVLYGYDDDELPQGEFHVIVAVILHYMTPTFAGPCLAPQRPHIYRQGPARLAPNFL